MLSLVVEGILAPFFVVSLFCFQAEDGIRDRIPSRGLGEVYKIQLQQQPGSPLVGQHPRVLLLMVGGDVGGGHKDRGLRDGGQLRDRRGPRPAQDPVT